MNGDQTIQRAGEDMLSSPLSTPRKPSKSRGVSWNDLGCILMLLILFPLKLTLSTRLEMKWWLYISNMGILVHLTEKVKLRVVMTLKDFLGLDACLVYIILKAQKQKKKYRNIQKLILEVGYLSHMA